jgi:hypothetical protein
MTDVSFKSKGRLKTNIVSLGWASDEQHLTYLVTDAYPNTVKNLGSIIATLNNELGKLEQERIVITDVVMDTSESNVLVLLEAKRVSNGWYGPVETFGTFGVDNISDWRIWDIGTGVANGTGVSAVSFTVTGAVAGSYHPTAPVVVDGFTYIIQSATNPPIPPAPQITTVVVQTGGPPISFGPGLVVNPPQIVYTYGGVGWDSDAAIIQEVEAFATGYDHLTHPLGLTGTYGLNERIDQLEKGRDLQDANKAAYENFIQWYEAYMQ